MKTEAQRLRAALLKCLKAMEAGRPSDPRDNAKWDRVMLSAERALITTHGKQTTQATS